MATTEELYTALRNADAAGDTAGAQKLAAYIQSQQGGTPAPQKAAPAPQETAPQQNIGTPTDAIVEPIKQFLTAGPAAVAGGLAGLGAAGTRLLGLTKTEPADVVRNVQSALTYQPKTVVGQLVNDVGSTGFRKFGDLANKTGEVTSEATGSPALGAAANTAIQMAPSLLTRGRFGNGRVSPVRSGGSVAAGEAESAAQAAEKTGRQPGLAGVPEKAAVVPSIEELKAQSQAAYKQADEAGIQISSDSLKGLKTRIATDLNKEGLDPTLHPSTTAALKRVVDTNGDISLSNLETLRKIASSAEKSLAPADARLAGRVVDHIDNFIENLNQKDVVSGTPEQAAVLSDARSLWSRYKKAQTIQTLFDRAELSAPNFSGSGMENAIRTEFRALAKNERRMGRFTPEEQAAIKKVALGGPLENGLRQLGKLAPTGAVSTATSVLSGFTLGGPVGAAALPIVGGLSRAAATRMTMKNANAASEIMRRGPQTNALKSKSRNALVTP